METLFLRFLANNEHRSIDEETFVQWILHSDTEETENCGKIKLANINELAENRRVIILLPVEDFFLTELSLQAKNKKQLEKAIPYALEDDLAEDIEELHFAHGNKTAQGTHPVAVISKAKLQHLIRVLGELGVLPNIITVDIFGLAIENNHWTYCISENQVIARTGTVEGFGCELRDLNEFMGITLDACNEKPEMIDLYSHPDEDVEELKNLPNVYLHDLWRPTVCIEGFDEKQCINLLQGSFAKADKQSRAMRPWKIAAALTIVWIGLLMSQIGLEYWQLKKTDEALTAEIEQVFLTTFPEATNANNARTRMSRKLTELKDRANSNDRANADFLKLLHHIAYELSKNEEVSITSIRYRNAELSLEVNTKDIQMLEKAKNNLRAKNITAELQSAKSEKDFIRAQLVISE